MVSRGFFVVLPAAAGLAWFLREKSLRRTHPTTRGLHAEVTLPHRAEWELWHNAFSLCSKKVRLCLAELGVEHESHHVDLVETGGYETLGRRFLAVNPAGLVPVLVHHGHPVYESHEIIRYAADLTPRGASLVPSDPAAAATMDAWVHRSSLFGDDPVRHAAESAGNCVPGMTIPLFAAMIGGIPSRRIVEGLLFHRLKQRPAFFLALKAMGLPRLASAAPIVKAIHDSRAHMERHLDDLEAHLAEAGTTWIAGESFSLADVSWAVILDRLREADWTEVLESPRRPLVSRWWRDVKARPSYAEAMLGAMEHPLVTKGTRDIVARKAHDPRFRRVVYGED